jgi:hypothetical protein
MSQQFRLFWLRETGCDAGTPLRAGELDPEIRQRVLALAEPQASESDEGEIALRLPYLDRREWSRRFEILAGLPLDRRGNVISFALTQSAALRDTAATLALTNPAWLGAPAANDPNRFPVWQSVSMNLQNSFRTWIPEMYFRDIARFEDRQTAFPMIVYQAARICRGHSGGEVTYDFSDYPDCRLTLALSLKMTGLNLQAILAIAERRLNEAGMHELARRYAPVWYQDVVVAVRKKPKLFLALLRAESTFINALVELSLNRTPEGVNRFFKTANQALRKVHGMDLRPLGARALERATEVLAASGGAMVVRK